VTRLSIVGALVLSLVASASPSAAVDEVPLFLRWEAAVVGHTPGQADAALQSVWSMGLDDRKAVNDKLQNFLDVLAKPLGTEGPDSDPRLPDRVSINEHIVIAAREAAHRFTPSMFLERAAMLHADAVMFDRRPAGPPPAASKPTARTAGLTGARGVLVSEPQAQTPEGSGFVTLQDGETTGRIAENWNWPFARGLLDRVKPMLDTDPFVAAWYHGTASYLMRHGDFGEIVRHLDRAAEILPNNARILFDRGTVAEAFAMNVFQQIASERAPGTQPLWVGTPTVTSTAQRRDWHLPEADASNLQARELYERTIALNPGYIEAHVRLARLLELEGEFAGALDQVDKALALHPPSDVAFYAHLFAARAANALGQDEAAAKHASAALALYPSAASALLAESYTALHRIDPGTAVEALSQLGEQPVDPVTASQLDPWQQYPVGAGRLAELALLELWNLTPAKTAH
jgi:tetratricopeptide (TPR) repeat protein